ncbi:MAG: hypothetical protein PHP25_01830 [Candidatus Moranbacteria bacterium]|nr:hypothetical protein [Candidatus Moranbacteria bacterium]
MIIDFSPDDLLKNLSQGDTEVWNFVDDLLRGAYASVALVMYLKGLLGRRILELYKICGYDLDRLQYHVFVELPDQRTGKLISTVYPYDEIMGMWDPERARHHFEARQYGAPNSFWALKDPPQEERYEYPIYTLVASFGIQYLPRRS